MQVGDAYLQPLKGWLLISVLWSDNVCTFLSLSAYAVTCRYIEHMSAEFATRALACRLEYTMLLNYLLLVRSHDF